MLSGPAGVTSWMRYLTISLTAFCASPGATFPRRYRSASGPTNQGNLARDGDQSFADMFTKEDSVHASGAFPVFGSFFPCLLAGNPGMWHRKGDAQGLQVSIDANSLTDPSGGSLFSGSSSTSP